MDEKKAILIEKIESIINEVKAYSAELPPSKFSTYLSRKMNFDFTYLDLANLFTETELATVEQFILIHKIEYVKELLLANELTLTEIALKLHYSSMANLSVQFKKITGITPSFFKMIKHKELITLKVGKIIF